MGQEIALYVEKLRAFNKRGNFRGGKMLDVKLLGCAESGDKRTSFFLSS
jgi:hypothetical protein